MSLENEKPLVSIVSPTYNAAQYVKRAIDSVMSQSYRNIEYYIADDGSVDNTREIIEDTIRNYSDQDIAVHTFFYEKNTGFAWHDEIIPLLKGKYICLLAGDDAMLPERIERQVAFMEGNQGAIVASFTWVEVDAPDPILKQGYEELFNSETRSRESCLKQLLDGQNFFNAPSVMFELDAYKRLGGYNYKYRQAQDYGLWVKTLLEYDVAMFPEKLTVYSIHEGSLGALNNAANLNLFSREREEILTDAFLRIKDDVFLSIYREEIKQFTQSVPESELTSLDVNCIKVLFLFELNSYIHDVIAIRLYYHYADDVEFNRMMRERYGKNRGDIHAYIKARNLYKLNPNADSAKMTDELMDILDGAAKPITVSHISSLYEVCSQMENGRTIFKEVINRVYDSGIPYWQIDNG